MFECLRINVLIALRILVAAGEKNVTGSRNFFEKVFCVVFGSRLL